MILRPFPLEEETFAENDPGKDLFALLFVSFLLLGSVLGWSLSAGEKQTPLKTNAAGKGPVVSKRYLARLKPCGKAVCLLQAGKSYVLPEEASRVAREGLFPPGFKERTLIVLPPPPGLKAADLLLAVSALNQAGLRVEFRAPRKE